MSDIENKETIEKTPSDNIINTQNIADTTDTTDLSNPLFALTADKTAALFNEMHKDNAVFSDALSALFDGDTEIELKKKYVLKAINEVWVKVIEDSLIALDDRIRNYGRHLQENEEVMPIELSRNITSRSLQHLAQHTEYIQKIEGDMITPSKILNVFRDETILTYENKFVNTLINRLYIFVRKRYMIAKKQGLDEKSTVMKFSTDFEHDNIKGRINLGIEIAETLEGENQSQYVYSTKLWERVEKLYNIVEAYAFSEFAESMGKNYIRPPVMRTNAILKNKNLKQCLVLWEFIESYRDVGYGVLVQENSETVDDEYLREIYSFAALQYVLFRHNIKNEFSPENTLESQITEEPIAPQFVSEVKKVEESEFNVFDTAYQKMLPISKLRTRGRLSDSEKDIMAAIDVILAVLPTFDERRIAEEEARRQAEEEAARIAAEKEAMRVAAEEAARIAAEKEQARIAAEEAARIAAIEHAKQVEEEARRFAAEQSARIVAEVETKRQQEDAQRRAAYKGMPRKRKKKLKARALAQEKAQARAMALELEKEAEQKAEQERIAEEFEAERLALEEAKRREAEMQARQIFDNSQKQKKKKRFGKKKD